MFILSSFEFISTLVKSLAWPVVMLIITVILKKPIESILSNLSTVSYKDITMNFSKKLSEIESSLDTKIPSSDASRLSSKDKEIMKVAEISPEASISMSWTMLEQEISNTIKRLSISPDHPINNSPFRNVQLLFESELIDSETKQNIEEFRQLRNKATHGHHSTQGLSINQALQYHRLSKSIAEILKNIRR